MKELLDSRAEIGRFQRSQRQMPRGGGSLGQFDQPAVMDRIEDDPNPLCRGRQNLERVE
ncbi:MAG: hypothetical protein R3F40_19070 [Candidatus Competibacteraceae bacterium]